MVKKTLKRALGLLGLRLADRTRRRMAVLRPEGKEKGRVLLSWGTPVYETLVTGRPIIESHPSAWTNFQVARCFLDLGFRVDVIGFNDSQFIPRGGYDFLLDVESNLERLSPRMGEDCVKILFSMFAHWSIHNANSYRRHLNLLQRRGVALKPTRLLPPHLSVENADHIICPGGEFSANSYAYGGRNVIRVAQVEPFPASPFSKKDFQKAKRRFLWLSGGGPVHKGLDIVLEAFAQMPDYELIVCCNLDKSKQFKAEYQKELYNLKNINTPGFVDTRSEDFSMKVRSCAGMIHASASEISCTSVIGCMSRGLIPLGTLENDIDMNGFGMTMTDDSVEAVKEVVQGLSGKSDAELSDMSEKAWEASQARYGRHRFLNDFRAAICQISGERPPEVWMGASDEIKIPAISIRNAPG